jgi:type III restriction enzyme
MSWCSTTRPTTATARKPAEQRTGGELKGDDKKEAEKNTEAARLWISGLEAVNRKLGLSTG